MGFPESPEFLERSLGKRDIAISGAFSKLDVQHLPAAINVGDSQVGSLLQAKAAGIDAQQADVVVFHLDMGQDAPNFLSAEYDGKLELASGPDELQDSEFPLQCDLNEELDPAKRDRRGGSRVLLYIRHVKKILSNLLLCDPIGGPLIVVGQLADCPNIHLLRPLRFPSKNQVFKHTSSQFSHDTLLSERGL